MRSVAKVENSPARKYLLLATALLLLAVGAVPWAAKTIAGNDASANETTTTTMVPVAETTAPPATTPAQNCAGSGHFFAFDVTGHKFGPEAPTTVPETLADFAARRNVDCALLVADSEYLFNEYTDPDTRMQKTIDMMADPALQEAAEARFADALATAQSISIEELSGPYQTMYMMTEARAVPEIFQGQVDRPTFVVLKVVLADGTVKYFKLNCGYQPVDQSFPESIPGTPPAPSKNQPPKPHTPSTPQTPETPTTTAPPTPTIPPTTAPKCAGQTGPYCGTPDSGPELIPVQEPTPGVNNGPTPGYTPPAPNTTTPGTPGTGAGGTTPNDGNGNAGTNNTVPTNGSGQVNNGDEGEAP